jgi:aldehyde dehydrogenase (NAD+)
MGAYLRAVRTLPPYSDEAAWTPELPGALAAVGMAGGLDRTLKFYIGGKQTRPDGGTSVVVRGATGERLAEVGWGNRKDVRDAVEAARTMTQWTAMSGHARAQVLYYLAENLEADEARFVASLEALTGVSREQAAREVSASVARLMLYAGWADKRDGAVKGVPFRGVVLGMPEPWGVAAVSAPDEAPLLAFISLMAPLLAMGNRVVVTPSPRWPVAALELVHVMEASDVPAGTVNVVAGDREILARVLADHEEVALHWYVGSAAGSAEVERRSAGNLKGTWVNRGAAIDWFDASQAAGSAWLLRAAQMKSVWIPYGA